MELLMQIKCVIDIHCIYILLFWESIASVSRCRSCSKLISVVCRFGKVCHYISAFSHCDYLPSSGSILNYKFTPISLYTFSLQGTVEPALTATCTKGPSAISGHSVLSSILFLLILTCIKRTPA